jgi:hypothetical protein
MGCSNRCHEPVSACRPEARTAPRIVSFSNGANQSRTRSRGRKPSVQCLPRNNAVIADIQKTRPDLLVLTNLTMGTDQMGSVANELEKVKSYVGKIVVLGAPPEVKDPHACYTPSSTPANCASPVSNDYKTWVKNNALVATELGGVAVDVTDWFCVSGFWPAFAGTVPTRWDGTHQSSAYAVKLAPVLLEAFKNAHIFT